jgi:alkylhydroperoxidase/carboxymuconolactone decarboxylase family protein YurZ
VRTWQEDFGKIASASTCQRWTYTAKQTGLFRFPHRDFGSLDEKFRRLVNLALSIGAGLEGATYSAVRNARNVGVTQEVNDPVALLAVSTLGMPAATRAFT